MPNRQPTPHFDLPIDSSCALTTPRVAAVLSRLFAESRASDEQAQALVAAMDPQELRRQMSDPNADYRAFYGLARELYLAVAPETARLLYLLARATGARTIVEFGTSFGLSTLHLAAALRDNGGGRLIGSELEPTKASRARAHLTEAGIDEGSEIREGDALETLARDLPERIDLVLLDGHKALYPRVLDLLLPRLRPGAALIADNAEASPDYVARVRRGSGFVSVPFAADVELSIRL